MTIRLVIADDHEIFRKGLSSLFKNQLGFEVIGEAGDGDEVLNVLSKHEPEILLLDISMPKVNGLSAVPEIKKRFPKVKIILLTMHEEPPFLNKALALGANGYVLKTTGEEELFKAIRRVQQGETAVDPFLAGEALRLTLAGPVLKKRKIEDSGISLSDREVEVLKYVAKGYTDK